MLSWWTVLLKKFNAKAIAREVLFEKGVLKNFIKFAEKKPVPESLC